MRRKLKHFAHYESGAVTVDWVVITAAVCGLCIALIALLNDETRGLSQLTGTFLTEQTVGDADGGAANE